MFFILLDMPGHLTLNKLYISTHIFKYLEHFHLCKECHPCLASCGCSSLDTQAARVQMTLPMPTGPSSSSQHLPRQTDSNVTVFQNIHARDYVWKTRSCTKLHQITIGEKKTVNHIYTCADDPLITLQCI